MKITLISAAYPYRGGIAAFTSMMYKELIKEHDVEIVTFKRQYPGIFFPGKTQFDTKDSSDKVPSIRTIDSINPINWILEGISIRNTKPDLVIFNFWLPFFGPCFGTILRMISKDSNIKSMIVCHNVIPHEKKPGDKTFTKYFFCKANYFITLSKSVRDDLLSIKHDAKYKLLFHPVYSNFGDKVEKTTAKKFLKLNDDKVILFFGFIRDYKGLDTLLYALKKIKKDIKLKLLVAGEFYSDETKYKKIVEDFKLNNFVQFFSDFIPSQEVKYYFSASDAVILPYKSATQSGIVQIANHFHKPLIGTNTGGLGEIIKDGKNGYLVDPDNPTQLAEAILKFYDNNNEEEFSLNVKEELDKFSWNEFTKGLLSLVNDTDKIEG